MLADKDAMPTIPVKDMRAARAFYETTLGFKRTGGMGSGVSTYRSGGTTIVVYETQFAGTNKATAATWGLGGDFDAVLRTLKGAGVAFEHYDLPEGRREGDVHIFGDFKAAWFKDPDGNILHVNNA